MEVQSLVIGLMCKSFVQHKMTLCLQKQASVYHQHIQRHKINEGWFFLSAFQNNMRTKLIFYLAEDYAFSSSHVKFSPTTISTIDTTSCYLWCVSKTLKFIRTHKMHILMQYILPVLNPYAHVVKTLLSKCAKCIEQHPVHQSAARINFRSLGSDADICKPLKIIKKNIQKKNKLKQLQRSILKQQNKIQCTVFCFIVRINTLWIKH